ncbi:MAG: carbohydrate binding family 9 domain-containing protein [bacterium]|nr:carbohydrate binding family 9 domain-containing protein [bacterium]
MKRYLVFFSCLPALLLFVFPLFGVVKTYTADLVNPTAPVIDGRLDDGVWRKGEWCGGFIQRTPHENQAPSQETLFKILYDQKNLYVGIRALDDAPESIVRQLTRRDNREGDWVEIIFDSYFDRRTGFAFAVNAAGVKHDMLISEDGDSSDPGWDPIWYVKTVVDDRGWTAEMQIPFSQLRYDNNEEQEWGLQVTRYLHRRDELNQWQLIPPKAPGFVAFFGNLKGLKSIRQQRRIELLPYSVGKHQHFSQDAANPFSTGSSSGLTGGLDGKMAISNNLTLDFSINPDFGQVEADPSEVNLSAFESYFREKRPFFVEGKNILNFQLTTGDGGYSRDNLFYSRRIGRAPQHSPDLEDDQYIDSPSNTSIIGAFKLTGKMRNGLSFAILESLTAKENAVIDFLGDRSRVTVEPLTNYFSLRIRKDYNYGKTIIGGMITAVNRSLKEEHLRNLHSAAYTGGFDVYHSWKKKTWYVSLNTVFSHVRGADEAILETQESSLRYFQRPDADYVTLDPERTSLSGYGGTFFFGKSGGGHIRFSTGVTWRSPGLELNDIGYLRSADRIMQWVWVNYRQTEPSKLFRNFYINCNQSQGWNFGGERIFGSGNINFYAQFNNYWSFRVGFKRLGKSLSGTDLRGGPSLKKDAGFSLWGSVHSDARKRIRFRLGWHRYRGNTGSMSYGFWGWAVFRLTDALSFSLRPSYDNVRRSLQYVDTLETGSGDRYIFSALKQKTAALTLRLDYSITPDLTIQFYGQPFISSGKYTDFKNITDSRAHRYEDRFHIFRADEIIYDAGMEYYDISEAGGEVHGFDDPDFNFLQFRSNLVVRWEYVPGSTVYVVWSQGRTDSFNNGGEFSLRRGIGDLFRIRPDDVFLIKFTYRFK